MTVDLFREAVTATRNGRRQEAYQLLQELLIGQPDHELGWLWLSRVSPDLEEQIYALESAQALNPDRKETTAALENLKQKQAANGLSSASDTYQLALASYQAGRPHQAQQRLRDLVMAKPQHEKGWLGLSQLAQTPSEKIVALETAVALNPDNAQAVARLERLKIEQDDYLSLAKAYEQYGQVEQALAAYKMAMKQSASSADKHIAKKHYQQLVAEAEQRKTAAKESQKIIKYTNTNTTLLRLALGPIIIYVLLSFIHGGLNPLRIPIVIYLGTIGVVVGSLITVAAANTPQHPLWLKILGPEGMEDKSTRSIITALGVMLLLIPFMILFVNAITRLNTIQQALSATLN